MWDPKAICHKTAPAFPHLTSVFTSDFTWFRPHAHTCCDLHLESYILSNTLHIRSSLGCKMSQRWYIRHQTNNSCLTLYHSCFQVAGWGQLRFTWWIPLTQHPLILHLLAPHQDPSASLTPMTTAHWPNLMFSVNLEFLGGTWLSSTALLPTSTCVRWRHTAALHPPWPEQLVSTPALMVTDWLFQVWKNKKYQIILIGFAFVLSAFCHQGHSTQCVLLLCERFGIFSCGWSSFRHCAEYSGELLWESCAPGWHTALVYLSCNTWFPCQE